MNSMIRDRNLTIMWLQRKYLRVCFIPVRSNTVESSSPFYLRFYLKSLISFNILDSSLVRILIFPFFMSSWTKSSFFWFVMNMICSMILLSMNIYSFPQQESFCFLFCSSTISSSSSSSSS